MLIDRFVWIRVGDGGDYAQFDDLDAAIEYLNTLRVGRIDNWRLAGAGFDTPNFWGHDYVSCYWGDVHAGLESGMLPDEQHYIASRLEENYL